MLIIGGLGLLIFVGGSISWHVQRKETQRRTILKERAEAETRFLGLKAKAEQGDDQAQLHLGFGYMQGQGVKQDLTEAVKWFRKAAEQNNAQAKSMLGHNYANGYGVVTNLVEAYAWQNLAAPTFAVPNAVAMGMSPQQIADGQKRTEELRGQIEARLTTQAELGGTAAKNRLGNMYYYGQGLAKNEAKAVKYYRQAAELGNVVDAETLNTLAWILAVSKNAALRDGKEAVKWATQACDAAGNSDWQKLDTLAAAFAEAGNFAQAVKYQQLALDRSIVTRKGFVPSGMQDRMKLYQQGVPYRE